MKIGLVGAGQMGAAIGGRLVSRGCTVLSPLDGRSPATHDRARAAGITPCRIGDLADATLILSILPSDAAAGVVAALRHVLLQADGPTLVEANALSPEAKRRLLLPLAAAGARVADASIVGAPPHGDQPGPRLYVCGEPATGIAALLDRGLDVRALDEPIGAAAALKMSYAAFNKGMTALTAASLLMADAAGVTDALVAEWAISQPGLLERSRIAVPTLYPKARRWVAEFDEIAAFAEAHRAGGPVFAAMAAFFAERADTGDAQREASRLSAVLNDRLYPPCQSHT